MLKAIIIEDNEQHNQWLRSLLKPYANEIAVVGEANSKVEAIRIITLNTPDVVFLDIQLQGCDGFDIIQSLDRIDFKIIFTTSFDTYAVRALRLSAMDYLIKPINKDEFDQAIKRLLLSYVDDTQKKKIDVLINNISQVKKLALPFQTLIKFVNLDDIIRCQADSNYTWFYLTDGNKLLVTKCLKEYEDLLEPSGFFRVHQSHIINLKYISEFKRECGGIVVMEDSTEIFIARRRKDLFLMAIDRYQK